MTKDVLVGIRLHVVSKFWTKPQFDGNVKTSVIRGLDQSGTSRGVGGRMFQET